MASTPLTHWNRREFLKAALGGAVGAAGLIPYAGVAEAIGLGEVSRFTGLPLDAIPTSCTLCAANCGILGFLHNGRLRALLGNPKDPNSRGRICFAGLAGMNVQEDEERVLHPMLRQGKRGEGKWKRISWDEAFLHLARVLQEQGRGEKGRILVDAARPELLTRRFLRALSPGRDIALLDGERPWSAEVAHRITWGSGRGIPDLLRARTILNFGSNPYAHHELYVPFLQRLVEARTSGEARLITLDVRLSETAGLSDEWLPVLPGTDGLAALAMAHVILESGLHDKAFLERWTNCPEGRLRQHLAPYSPERAQEESGIPAADIRRVALAFATRRPSVAFSGDGVSRHVNGTQAERCILLLNAMMGNIDEPGGYCLPRRFSWEEPAPSLPHGSALMEMDPAVVFEDLLGGSSRVGLYLAYMANPAYALPHSDEVRRLLLSEERILNLIVMDSHVSETAVLADLVLPAATHLESWGLESRPSMEMIPHVGLRQPVVEPVPDGERLKGARVNRLDQAALRPRGEALSWDDLLLGIAWRMGGEAAKAMLFQGPREYLEKLLEQIPGLREEGGLGYLRKHGVWTPQGQKPQYRSFEHNGFPTPSGRLELFSKELEGTGVSPMPSYAPVKKFKGSELTLVPFKGVSWQAHPNAKWVSELSHESFAWINEATAKGMGLRDGDRVQVTSQGRRLIVRIRAAQGVHPGVLAIARGMGHWGYGHFATGEPFTGGDPDSHLIWWKKHGNGVHLEPLIPIRLDPISKGQAWMDTLVRIKKV